MPEFLGFTVVLRTLVILAINLLLVKSSQSEYIPSKNEYCKILSILSAPRITPVQDEITLDVGSNFTLHCEYSEEILWVKWNFETQNFLVTENQIFYPGNPLRRFGSSLHLVNVRARHVGPYYCVNKRSHADVLKYVDIKQLLNEYDALGIYIFVKDREQILRTGYWYNWAEFEHWFIECKPNDPSTEVLLIQDLQKQSLVIANSTAILTGEWKIPVIEGKVIYNDIRFDPTNGFTLESSKPLHDITCKGINYGSEQSERMEATYFEVAIFSDKKHHAVVGESFNFTCQATWRINNAVELEWILPNDGVGIRYHISPQMSYKRSKRMYVTTNILTIENVQISHFGIYSCKVNDIDHTYVYNVASYYLKILNSSDSYLDVHIKGSQSISGIVNRSIFLHATVNGFPQPTIAWYNRKGEEIKVSTKYRFQKKGIKSTLEIRDAQSMDTGIYTLKSSNDFKTSNLSYDVIVHDVPNVVMTDTYIRVNGVARLTCRVNSTTPSNVTFTLTKCSTKPHWPTCTNTSERINIKESQRGNSDIESIYECDYSPKGPTKVRCEVDNWITPFGKPEIADAHIFVSDFEPHSNMSVFLLGEPRELIKGEVLQFVCSAMVYHLAATDMQWYLNGSLLKDGHGVNITNSSSLYAFNETLEMAVSQTGVFKLECRAPYLDNRNKKMHANLTDRIYEPVGPFINSTNITPTIKCNISDTLKLQCQGRGVPKPSVAWLKDGIELQASDKIKFTDDKSNLTIQFVGPQDAGTYKCRISIGRYYVEAYTELQIDEINFPKDNTHIPRIWIYVFIAVCFGVSFLVIFLVYRMCRDRAKLRALKAAGLAKFAEGAVDSINPDLPVDEQAELLPYDQRYEFPREKLHLGKQLGCGAFGVVFQASADGIIEVEPSTVVAVKTVHPTADNEMIRALVSELKILVHLGRHLNVVNLLGAVTKNIEKRELMVIVEYCPLGSLKDFLLANREQFVNQIDPDTDEIDGRFWPHRKFANNGYENVTSSWRTPFSTCDLVSWGFQVARGMDYLASRKVMHGDLAVRNILLCENNVVKICDFGLARSLYKRTVYKKQGDAPLPVRWLALETFTDNVFSTFSDVWSFGIVLWEIFSLGQVPYPDIGHQNLFPMLRDGYRMAKPQCANDVLYEIMLQCWNEKPTERPLFSELERKLTAISVNAQGMNNVAINGNGTSEEVGSSLPSAEDCTLSGSSMERNHHYENMPMQRRALVAGYLMTSIENPSYGIPDMETIM